MTISNQKWQWNDKIKLAIEKTASAQAGSQKQMIMTISETSSESTRQFKHDYFAAIRVFRFLAEKDLKQSSSDAERLSKKKQVIEKHLAILEASYQLLSQIFEPSKINE
ncbi:MAG: hypothetical protein ACOH5I_18865 [Oligoflexus sp.]